MTLADVTLAILWIGLTAYTVFAGADFGGGFWDLVAGGDKRGAPQRNRIERSIGPVWEANHVWLIFVLVVVWTCFPIIFSSTFSTLYIPFTIAAFGIILRGTAFAFRKEVTQLRMRRLFGAIFALSSVLTPFAFGTVAGGVVSGRVPVGISKGNIFSSWINPSSLLGGVLAVMVCAYLAAVLLTADCRRHGENGLAESFRWRALIVGIAVGITSLLGILVLHNDAPKLFSGLVGKALPVIALSAISGALSLSLLWMRLYTIVRATAGLAVVGVIWSWGVAQYPIMLFPNTTVHDAAAPTSTLLPVIVGLGIGAVLVVPSLILLFATSQKPDSDYP